MELLFLPFFFPLLIAFAESLTLLLAGRVTPVT
jgi:hypothetical protein